MRVLSFSAEHFRNVGAASLSFSDGVNLLYGENAQGKTNILEAIYLFARGRSFRTADEKELVGFGAEGFYLTLDYEDADGAQRMEYAAFGRERKRTKNGVRFSRAAEMLGHFRAVLFTPEDLAMIKEGPELRRAFLNVAVSQCDPGYVRIYARYKTLLENRNALLRAAKQGKYVDDRELFAFSDEMADAAAQIRQTRAGYVERLGRLSVPFLDELSDGRERIGVRYLSDVGEEIDEPSAVRAEYRRVFTENIERERGAGTSLYGVQRDDLAISVNGVSVRDYGSQGQQRSAVLALKLAEGEATREITGEHPVFLFDDVMSELDERRRSFLLTAAKGRQTIMTSCELREDLLGSLSGAVRLFHVCGGEYERR